MGKEKTDMRGIFSVLPLLGLAFLLLLSPCKVKNTIQTQFGIAHTSVINKSQSTVSPTNCQILETPKVANGSEKPTFYPKSFLTSGAFKFPFPLGSSCTSALYKPTNHLLFSRPPFYILFQRLKVYL